MDIAGRPASGNDHFSDEAFKTVRLYISAGGAIRRRILEAQIYPPVGRGQVHLHSFYDSVQLPAPAAC